MQTKMKATLIQQLTHSPDQLQVNEEISTYSSIACFVDLIGCHYMFLTVSKCLQMMSLLQALKLIHSLCKIMSLI